MTYIIDSKVDLNIIVDHVSKCLESSEPFIFPTETVYGIGCKLYDLVAIEKIYNFKKRKFINPLSLYLSSIEQVYEFCSDIKNDFKLLAARYLPGPLSIILKQKDPLSQYLKTQDNSVLIRIPDNDIMLQILKKINQPIVGTSANKSGEIPAKSGIEAINLFNGQIALIIDDGPSKFGKESTIISLVEKEPRIIREGIIPGTELKLLLEKKN